MSSKGRGRGRRKFKNGSRYVNLAGMSMKNVVSYKLYHQVVTGKKLKVERIDFYCSIPNCFKPIMDRIKLELFFGGMVFDDNMPVKVGGLDNKAETSYKLFPRCSKMITRDFILLINKFRKKGRKKPLSNYVCSNPLCRKLSRKVVGRKFKKFKVCAECKITPYCCRKCQEIHWNNHRPFCRYICKE